MPAETAKPSERVAIIGAVKTYLGFFTLVVLVVEAVLGALALKTDGQNQLVALYGMLAVIVLLIGVVSFFAYRKPESLLSGEHAPAGPAPGQAFCLAVSGYWWERIVPGDASAISFVEIRPETATASLKMKGNAYTATGELVAVWETVASCVNPAESKIFYYWEGHHPARPNEPYEGFGEISFQDFAGGLNSGTGIFSDSNLTDMKSTTRKSVEFRRSTSSETTLMQAGDPRQVAELVRGKLA